MDFAIGRSIALKGYLDGSLPREDAGGRIADIVEVYTHAEVPAPA